MKNQPYYMYPFLHLLRDGSLFVFTSRSSQLFDPYSHLTIKELPELPGFYRTYPNTGGSVLLAMSSANNWTSDVVICGGGAYQDLSSPSEPSCGRISPLAENATWEMDAMPQGRVMVEGTLLPDGMVVWMNGCNMGAQGFGLGQDALTQALLYNASQPLGQRFTTGATSTIARMYHSVALLNADATITIAGSNPVEQPVLTPSAEDHYVTEFRVETYTPPYLTGSRRINRPMNVMLSTTFLSPNGSTFTISFTDPSNGATVSVVLYQGGFVTHSLHMGARMVLLDTVGFMPGNPSQTLNVTMPPSANIAIPGPYMMFVLVDGTPSVGSWVNVIMSAPATFSFIDSNITNRAINNTFGLAKSAAGRFAVSVIMVAWLAFWILLVAWTW